MRERTDGTEASNQEPMDKAKARASLGAILLFLSFAIGQISPIVAQPYGLTSIFITVPAFLAFYGFVALKVGQGRGWARTLAAVIVTISVAINLMLLPENTTASVQLAFQATLWALFVMLVYTKPGSSWFHR